MGTSAASQAIANLFIPQPALTPRERRSLDSLGPAVEERWAAVPATQPESPRHELRVLVGIRGAMTRKAREEARSLLSLIGRQGQTFRRIREQICIPSDAAREMFAFVEDYPDEACWILAAIEFRNHVLREFDKLGESLEHAQRIAEAEAEAARSAAETTVLPLLHELVVRIEA
jgi:hypothetical protein